MDGNAREKDVVKARDQIAVAITDLEAICDDILKGTQPIRRSFSDEPTLKQVAPEFKAPVVPEAPFAAELFNFVHRIQKCIEKMNIANQLEI